MVINTQMPNLCGVLVGSGGTSARKGDDDPLILWASEQGEGLDAKALVVIGSVCPISVEGVIRGLRWGIGPKGGKALSSHHIWTFIPPTRLSLGKNLEGGYRRMYGWTDVHMDGMNVHM
jgi:hypothetical protein